MRFLQLVFLSQNKILCIVQAVSNFLVKSRCVKESDQKNKTRIIYLPVLRAADRHWLNLTGWNIKHNRLDTYFKAPVKQQENGQFLA